jgi:hypothetical protein
MSNSVPTQATTIEFYCVDCRTIYGQDPSACSADGSRPTRNECTRSEKGRKG